jgi:hypothetical protein
MFFSVHIFVNHNEGLYLHFTVAFAAAGTFPFTIFLVAASVGNLMKPSSSGKYSISSEF